MKIFRKFFKSLGPGIITGSADDDPSGIATYSAAGAGYNFKFLWSTLFTLPLMIVVQEMCARIGMVTGQGLAAVFKKVFNKKILFISVILLFLANTFNIGADLGIMAASMNMVAPIIPTGIWIIVVALGSLLLEILLPYKKYFHVLKWLCLSLLAYWITALLVITDWSTVFKATIIPEWQWNKDWLMIMVAFLGTTISPYLFFWQTSEEVEDEIDEGKKSLKARRGATPAEIKKMRFDTVVGMIFSNISTYFIILTTAGTLFKNGIYQINTAADAALALRPLAGNFTYALFTIGIIGTGLLAIPVLAGALSYACSEIFGWQEGLSLKWRRAKSFYGIMALATLIGALINFIGLGPIKALIYSAVLNGLVAPVIIFLVIKVCNHQPIMGDQINGFWLNVFSWITFVFMAGAGMAFIFSLF